MAFPFFDSKTKITVPLTEEPTGFAAKKELIAPPALQLSASHIQIGNIYAKTILLLTYPRFLFAGWLSNVLDLEEPINVSIFVGPLDTPVVMKQLQKQLARVEAQIFEREERGLVRSPELDTAYRDIEELRDALIQSRARMFEIGVYITFFSETLDELKRQEKRVIKELESILIAAKPVIFQQMEAFQSTLPLCTDDMNVHYQMHTAPAASTFPFISGELTADQGVLLGVNLQNNTLVIFDRFSLENAHVVILARSGAGKSFAAKIEVMRSVMMGDSVIVLDPENEYRSIAEIYQGSFIPIALGSDYHINPFDLPPVAENENPADVLKEKIADLIGLIKILVGEGSVSPDELTLIDQAISQTYGAFNIYPDSDFSHINRFPTLNDFAKVLQSIEGGEAIAQRLYPYTEGSFSGFINQPSNIDLEKRVVAFGFRNLQEQLRPIGMYIALNYILAKVKNDPRRRIVIIDEAWWLMKHEAGANFLFDVVKRGRKYKLGVTTITQDAEDFLSSPFGRPIITNSAFTLLMKQSPAAISLIEKTFNVSEAEKKFLLQAERGRGILFAGLKHVPIYIVGSYAETQIIESSPEQLLAIREAKQKLK